MSYLLGIDFYYDNTKNRLFIEKIMNKHNGTLDCVTDKNGIFSFKDNESKQKADQELYKIGIISDPVTDSV
jgi:hypothetical protein